MDRKRMAVIPPPDKKLDAYFPARFLKPEDLHEWKVRQLNLNLTRAVEEQVQAQGKPEQYKLVLYFKTKAGTEFPRGYLVSAKADVDALKTYGVETVGDLAGKTITIYIADWRGQPVLRIKPKEEHEQA